MTTVSSVVLQNANSRVCIIIWKVRSRLRPVIRCTAYSPLPQFEYEWRLFRVEQHWKLWVIVMSNLSSLVAPELVAMLMETNAAIWQVVMYFRGTKLGHTSSVSVDDVAANVDNLWITAFKMSTLFSLSTWRCRYEAEINDAVVTPISGPPAFTYLRKAYQY